MLTPALQGHPFLDPDLVNNDPGAYRHLYKWYMQIRESPEQYNDFLNKIFHPIGERRPLQANLTTAAYYLNEAVSYLSELLLMISPEARGLVTPRPEVVGCPDLLELLTMIFCGDDRRLSFEAQRKLYLTKLFFDVDHCWEVQRGGEHKEYFESILERELFTRTVTRAPVDICYGIGSDGESIEYTFGRNGKEQECWSFDLREVEVLRENRPMRFHVYYYSCRFKREVIPFQYARGADHYQLAPADAWPGLTKRRSASIVSKMIRKGENDPRWIQDLIGAMFIVENLYEIENLKEWLFSLFGGVFRIRNAVDTLTRPADRSLLNPWSGQGYEVYKSEVDLLYNPRKQRLPMPYFFTVELQMYTLESYLRTIHSSHYANHQVLKRRQFLEGLVPYLFPDQVYGPETMKLLVEDAGNWVQPGAEASPRGQHPNGELLSRADLSPHGEPLHGGVAGPAGQGEELPDPHEDDSDFPGDWDPDGN